VDNDAAVDDNDHHLATNNAVPRNVVDMGRCAVPWRPGRSCTGQGLMTLFIGRGGWNPLSLVAVIPETGRGAHRAKMNGILGGRSRRRPCRTPPLCMYDGYLGARMSGVGTWSGMVVSLGLAHAVAFSGAHLRAGAHRGNGNCGVFLVFQRGEVGR
jgi:hypothetical protein